MLKIVTSAATLVLCACTNADTQTPEALPVDTGKVLTEPLEIGATEMEAAAESMTHFGLDLYGEIQTQQGAAKNVFISPASLSTAFALLYPGARETTADELKSLLRIERDANTHTTAMGALIQALEKDAEGERVSINNALWTDKLTVLEQAYVSLIRQTFNAGDNRVDFRNDPDSSRITINDWVEEKTEGLIKDLLAPPNIKKDTRNVLVNTIYMKADWARPFTKEASREDTFHLAKGEDIQTMMMNQTSMFKHTKGRGYSAVELPYRNNNLSMAVLLPTSKTGLPALEERVLSDPAALDAVFANLSEAGLMRVEIKLPKLKIKNRFELKEQLKALGMQRSFTDDAEFWGIADPAKQPDGAGIKISEIIHQTFLEVDEKGTEAAAATAIVGVRITSSQMPPPNPPIKFHADHPFVLAIRDNRTGTLLFLGRIVDPR